MSVRCNYYTKCNNRICSHSKDHEQKILCKYSKCGYAKVKTECVPSFERLMLDILEEENEIHL